MLSPSIKTVETERHEDGTHSVLINGIRYIDHETYAIAHGIADTLRGAPGAAGELCEVARQIAKIEDRKVTR